MTGQLHGRGAHGARSAHNQHPLARPNAALVAQEAQRSDATKAQRCSLGMSEVRGLPGNRSVFGHDAVLGVTSEGFPGKREDLVAYLELGDRLARGLDDAR
jgi:hypothetical protein